MPLSQRPEIFLGDLVRVVGRVAHDAGEVHRAAVLLGLAGSIESGPTGPVAATIPGGPGAGAPQGAPGPGPVAEQASTPVAERSPRPLRSVRVIVDAPAARPAADFLAGRDVLPAPPLEESDPPAPAPLFRPRWERALVAAAISVAAPGGAVDLDEVVRRMARARPITRLPLRQRPSLRQGAHVLIDTGKAMLAFFDDRRLLAANLRRVVGTDRTTVARFVGTPARGAGSGAAADWAPFVPAPGRPVVLVSDLGVAPSPDRAGADEWLAFAAGMADAGCRVVAISPYPASRVPPALAAAVTGVVWDASTGPGQVARASRRHR
jgi:hypothetical protein